MTHLYFISTEHTNARTNYYDQEQFCQKVLFSAYYKEGDVILVEDDPTKKVLDTYGPVPENARVLGWYDPEVRKIEDAFLKLRPVLERINLNRHLPHEEDIQALKKFVVGKPRPEVFDTEEDLPLPDLIDLASYFLERQTQQTFESTWEARQAFLKKQIFQLKKEGVKNIFVKGGGLHFDSGFVNSLELPYQFFDIRPAPAASIAHLPLSIQQVP